MFPTILWLSQTEGIASLDQIKGKRSGLVASEAPTYSGDQILLDLARISLIPRLKNLHAVLRSAIPAELLQLKTKFNYF